MKIRISTIVTLMMAVGAGFVLFQTSQNVQRAEDRLHDVREALSKEQGTVRVLETEWDYLNRPDRIEDLARQHLKMSSPDLAALVKDGKNIPEPGHAVLPPRKPVLAATSPSLRQGGGASSAPAITPNNAQNLPMPSPVANDSRQQFNDLLNDLAGQEPSAGGAP
ncbi:MAG: energy transducer TonB [Micavibrio aeruginosavorus]|nr:energy transducer TonB [Micavibrio aeruginosavorus]